MSDNVRDTGSQVIVRLPSQFYARLERLTQIYMKRSLLGVKIGKATVAREAMLLGLPLLESKFEKENTNEDT